MLAAENCARPSLQFGRLRKASWGDDDKWGYKPSCVSSWYRAHRVPSSLEVP